MRGTPNALGFPVPIASHCQHHPDSPKKTALRLDVLADRVLDALKPTILQTGQIG
jgi:hypothetical protein